MEDKYVKVPKKTYDRYKMKYEEYLALEKFYKENLTKKTDPHFIFPLVDSSDPSYTIESDLYAVPKFIIDINFLNKELNKKVKRRFINKFAFEINRRDIYELRLFMYGVEPYLIEHVATIKFSDRFCIIKRIGEKGSLQICYLNYTEDYKSYTTNKFWDLFIKSIVNIL